MEQGKLTLSLSHIVRRSLVTDAPQRFGDGAAKADPLTT
jgi:hypothetical protein